jgi:hypothetical protein
MENEHRGREQSAKQRIGPPFYRPDKTRAGRPLTFIPLNGKLLMNPEGGYLMADIFRAYKFMNDALGLKLSDTQIARAEARFKLHYLREEKYNAPEKNLEHWEFFAHLAPRKDFSRPDLASAARDASDEPGHSKK